MYYDNISLSHIDMDGVGAQFSIKETHSGVLILNANYHEIGTYLDTVADNISSKTEKVFITDLAFESADLTRLNSMVNSYSETQFIYIDHHEYTEQDWALLQEINKKDNFLVIHSIKASATKLAWMYLKPKNENLAKLVEVINAYDIWLEDDPLFQAGWVYNTMFWDVKLRSFVSQVEAEGYKMPGYFKRRYKDIVVEKNDYFKKLFEAKYITVDTDKKFMFAFADSFKPFLTIDFPEYNVYLIASSYNSVSVRFRGLDEPIARKIKDAVIATAMELNDVTSAGGHLNAFGITVRKDATFDELKNVLQIVQEKIYEFSFE